MAHLSITPSPELLQRIRTALEAVPAEKRGAAKLTLLTDGSLIASVAVKGKRGKVDFTLGAFYDRNLNTGGQAAGVGGTISWEPVP